MKVSVSRTRARLLRVRTAIGQHVSISGPSGRESVAKPERSVRVYGFCSRPWSLMGASRGSESRTHP